MAGSTYTTVTLAGLGSGMRMRRDGLEMARGGGIGIDIYYLDF